MPNSSPSDFISFGDWLGSNADQERASLSSLTDTAQQGTQNAVGDAYKQGYGSFSSQGTPGAAGGYDGSDLKSYGDYVNSLSDPSGAGLATQANAMQPGGHYSWLDALGMQTAGGDQVAAAKSDYGQRLSGANAAYAGGVANAAGASSESQAAYAQGLRNAGYGWNTNTSEGAAGYGAELAAGKKAQSDSYAAGAQYRLAREQAQYEADQKHNAGIEQGVFDVLNPIGGIGWGMSKSAPSYTGIAKLGGHIEDPFSLGGDAHSGFGQGGKFGSPLGMGDAGQGDPAGQYSDFQAWLSKQGYDPNTGNGNGY